MNESEVLQKLFSLVQSYLDENPGKVVEYLSPLDLKQRLELDQKKPAGDLGVLFTEIENYLHYAVKTRHPQYLNQLWGGFSMPVFMGEVISALCNTSMYTYEVAPVATLLEKKLIAELLAIMGFTDGEAQFTTGGSNGNMLAMMIARNKVVKSCKSQGLQGAPLVGFVSAESHYSFDKAANILGLGTDCLIKVPVDSTGGMDLMALETLIEKARATGQIPFFIGATAGTTVRGAFDNIAEIRKIASKQSCWLHVDGAWGGSVILSSDREKYLSAVEQADSFVWDAHKMMGITLICSLFAVREKGHFDQTFKLGDTSYIFHGDEETSFDLGPSSLQCGRRNDILKFWLEWCYVGRDGFRDRIDHFLSLVEYAQSKVLATPHLELMFKNSPLNVCFRYRGEGIEDLNDFNIRLRTQLHETGLSFVNYSYLEKTAVIRLVLANKDLTKADIDQFFANIETASQSLLGN